MGTEELARRLASAKDRIIESWLARVRSAIPGVRAVGEREVIDNIPPYLDALIAALGAPGVKGVSAEELDQLSRVHGRQRATLFGHSVQLMLLEYRLLRETVLELLEEQAPISSTDRDVLLAAIEQAMAASSAEFLASVELRERKRLAAARTELEATFMQAPTPIAVLTGPEHRFTLANLPFERMVKRPILGKTFGEAFAAEESTTFLPMLRRVYETGEPHVWPELPVDLLDEQGRRRQLYLNASLTPLKDSQGITYAVSCLMVDVSEHVEAHRIVEESEARFRQIANALPLIVWTGTADFFVDWYNDWWYQYLGLPRGTRWDDPATQPMHPDDVERTYPALREAVATGHDFLMEQRFRRGSDGQYRWHLVRGVPIRDAHGKVVKWVGANMDIQDQKTVTARLEEERELREQFVATLTHDLRSPLTAARANAQMLARRGSDPNLLHKLSARIVENLDRADRMIRDLLDANRIRAGEPLPLDFSECDVTALARETVEELALVHGDRFVVHGAEGVVGQFSCESLRRIIENLCSNAVKYGAIDQPVTVRIGSAGGDEVSISVHNQGNPIAPEDQRRLFQQYRRLGSSEERGQKGWGLGLTLVEGLAHAHGGSVRVESAPETGTTFTVTIPRNRPALPSPVNAGRGEVSV